MLGAAPPALAREGAPWSGLLPFSPPALALPAATIVAADAPPAVAPDLADPIAQLPPLVVPAGAGPAAGRPSAMVALYVSYAGLQALDAVTTLRALDAGASEQNPLVGRAAAHPGALLAVKAGVAVGTIYLAERLHKRNRAAAVVLMAVLNGAYLAIVANNHSLGGKP